MPSETARSTVVVVVALCHATLELVEGTLRESGYRVLATSNVAEVLQLAQSVAIDLLVRQAVAGKRRMSTLRERSSYRRRKHPCLLRLLLKP
jgi:DNA-binding NtrC family response regulator